MTPEGQAQSDVLCAFGWLPLWRRNVGAGSYRGRQVKFGKKGMADLWGILPDGRHIEVEMKSPTGRQTKEQKQWQRAVEERGAIYVVARSVDDVWRALDEHGYDLRERAAGTQGQPPVDAMEARGDQSSVPNRRAEGPE